jgi:hypothetical protein
MKNLTDKEANKLQREIDYILDTGANSIRLLELIDKFLHTRYKDDYNKEELLEKLGWTIECQSPLEIVDKDGNVASGWAANIVINHLIENFNDYYEEQKN